MRYNNVLFTIQLLGVLSTHLTVHLWHSYTFTLYTLCAFLRVVLGAFILGIASRYVSGIARFSNGQDPDYNVLPPETKDQVALLFELLLTNGLAGGIFALCGGWISLAVAWRRNKAWLAVDAVLICAGVFFLTATFISTYWLHMTHEFFCQYAGDPDMFPVPVDSDQSFGYDVCQAIKFHYRMNYQYWVTFTSVIVSTAQLVHGLLILFSPAIFEPMEWRIAQRLLLVELKQRHYGR